MKNWNKILWLPLVFSFLAGIYACSHGPSMSEKVDEEAKSESPVHMGGSVAAHGMSIIENSKSLTVDQKLKLTDLSKKMMEEMTKLRDEEGQLKMVLFKTIVDPKADNKKIRTIKNKIISLDRKKTDKMLSALDEAQKIMGRRSAEDEEVYRALMLERHERFNY
jgi:hypothetical protein